MGIKTESLANACNLSEGLTPDIYIKRTVTKQNNVFFIDGECPALTLSVKDRNLHPVAILNSAARGTGTDWDAFKA